MGAETANTELPYCKIVKKMSTEEVELKFDKPRQELIDTAVRFLQNKNILSSTRSSKETFLKRKGLSDEEIRIAFEKAGTDNYMSPSSVLNIPLARPVPQEVQIPWFQKLKEILNTLALIGGLGYFVYYLYKRFIAQYLFGKKKKPKTVEQTVQELNDSVNKSVTNLTADMSVIQNDVKKLMKEHKEHNTYKVINELKAEITTVKGLLLNRHQFPSVSLSSTSIPAWQLTSSNVKDKEEDIEQASGCSETEMVQNPNSNGGSQGSDSSLEMIKEVDS